MKPIEILLLSQSHIIQLDLRPDDVLGAVEQAMREHSGGADPTISSTPCPPN
jgi:hypothetical protein